MPSMFDSVHLPSRSRHISVGLGASQTVWMAPALASHDKMALGHLCFYRDCMDQGGGSGTQGHPSCDQEGWKSSDNL